MIQDKYYFVGHKTSSTQKDRTVRNSQPSLENRGKIRAAFPIWIRLVMMLCIGYFWLSANGQSLALRLICSSQKHFEVSSFHCNFKAVGFKKGEDVLIVNMVLPVDLTAS